MIHRNNKKISHRGYRVFNFFHREDAEIRSTDYTDFTDFLVENLHIGHDMGKITMNPGEQNQAALPRHSLRVVLVEPDIPQNAGNIARLCAIVGAELHLVKPMGFFLTEKHFRRSGMDYLNGISLKVHESLDAMLECIKANSGNSWLLSAHGEGNLWTTPFKFDDWLLLGSETAGLPPKLIQSHRDRTVKIPMQSGQRCLNVATAARIVVYEALRQIAGSSK
jgi:tRNA (cytidine/uridine-2'-O-)-methyltransferase